MNFDDSIIPVLFLATFVLALVIGVWQFRRARKARQEHHTSADAHVHGDKPARPVSEQAPSRETPGRPPA
jgi:cytochrome oxidase assembly protein ShyY1